MTSIVDEETPLASSVVVLAVKGRVSGIKRPAREELSLERRRQWVW